MFESKDGSKAIVLGAYKGKYNLTGKQLQGTALTFTRSKTKK